MRRKPETTLVGLAVLIHFGISVAGLDLWNSERQVFSELIRKSRSIKDALPKDDEFSQSRAILDMRHKIFSLENAMKNVNSEMEKMSQQNTQLEEEIAEQRSIIQKLDSDFSGVKGALESHSDMLGDLGKIVSPDDNLFALSNQSCGGVLVAQSGSIVFSSAAVRGIRLPSSCIWTIRANNREKIKVSTHFSQFPYRTYAYTTRQYAYVVELVGTNQSIRTNTTRLQRNMHHIFSGPLLFVVYPLSVGSVNDDYSEMELHLQYEGMGKLVQKDTSFSHKMLSENSGAFNDTQIEPQSPPENVTYSMDYTTLIVSNFSTKVHLQAILDQSGGCAPDDSFIVITELLENNTAYTDCCRTNCEGKNSLINYDNPFVIIITKKYQAQLKFRIEWVAETPYPSSSRSILGTGSSYSCGEILGGVSGSVLYKPHVSYQNGERCIWVIVPQPRPRSSIVISVGANGVENTYDHLYMMELTDVNGTALADGPKITRLGRYGSYEAYSREVYIVFYSDSSVTGYGFSLSWKSAGTVVKTESDVTTRFTILKHHNGNAQTKEMAPLLTNGLYDVFLLTPILPYAYEFGLQLHINQTSPVPGPNDCIHQDIKVYTAQDGMLGKAKVECNDPGKAVLENADGLAVLVVENHDDGHKVAMNFSWKQVFGGGNDSYVAVENNQCGGVIKGSKGVLKYKIGFDYLNNERCVWLLQSPNSTSITLKLLKDGFEQCCDHILVNTIEPTDGTMRNDTVVINRVNRTRTFEESVLVVVFQTDGSTRGRGFALQFVGNGQADSPPAYRYQMHHHNEPLGEVQYPSPEWEDPLPGIQDIILIASSIKIGPDENPLIVPTNISWMGGYFKNSWGNCTFDSITFYSTPESDGWSERARFPNENDTISCPDYVEIPKRDDIFTTVYSAFLVIYKPLELPSQSSTDDENRPQLGMSFKFEKSAGCGGVIIGEAGDIRYKEDGRYSNLEKCVWLVHVPQAQRIRFWLERSGFEECCDVLLISSIDRKTAIPQQHTIISQFNRTTVVDGPVAIVSFITDSSVLGDGFRLSFSTETETTEDFPFRYHLEHRNQPRKNDFAFTVDPNEVVIVAYNPEIHRQTYQGTGSTEITVASFRPQISEECQSDKLIIYDIYGKDKGLVQARSFEALDVLADIIAPQDLEGNCTHLRDTNYHPCEDILDCGDVPTRNVVMSNTTSFLAIYRSLNVSDEGLNYRGFVMQSTTTFPAGSTTSEHEPN